MSEPNHDRKRYGMVSQLARLILDGPRAVMFPDDPKGMKLWLEPIIRMKLYSPRHKTSNVFSVYSVSNSLQRQASSPILVRSAKWESGSDKESCKPRTEIGHPLFLSIRRYLQAK